MGLGSGDCVEVGGEDWVGWRMEDGGWTIARIAGLGFGCLGENLVFNLNCIVMSSVALSIFLVWIWVLGLEELLIKL